MIEKSVLPFCFLPNFRKLLRVKIFIVIITRIKRSRHEEEDLGRLKGLPIDTFCSPETNIFLHCFSDWVSSSSLNGLLLQIRKGSFYMSMLKCWTIDS